ncbi:MAG: hypothetical protein HZY76_19775 [Anaerolineae bacterium]|nr:MAG: hypothetical protein HZY76_19775 [Anaerolineae bacterium]
MPTYPVIIDGTKTGLDGVACVGCNIQNTENIVNENLNDYASITLLAGIASTAHIAVQDVLTDYPAGTFAGFDIEHPKLIDVNVLSNITVRTYLNNVLQETRTGTGQLIFANTSLLGDDGRRTVGFIASLPFDTVRISVTSFAGADVGVIKVYRAVFQRFCEVNLVCNQTYWLVNPTFPVVIDGPRTGLRRSLCRLFGEQCTGRDYTQPGGFRHHHHGSGRPVTRVHRGSGRHHHLPCRQHGRLRHPRPEHVGSG